MRSFEFQSMLIQKSFSPQGIGIFWLVLGGKQKTFLLWNFGLGQVVALLLF